MANSAGQSEVKPEEGRFECSVALDFLMRRIEGALNRTADWNPLSILTSSLISLTSLAVALASFYFAINSKTLIVSNLLPFAFLVVVVILLLILFVFSQAIMKPRIVKVLYLSRLQTELFLTKPNLKFGEQDIGNLTEIIGDIETMDNTPCKEFRLWWTEDETGYVDKANSFLDILCRPHLAGKGSKLSKSA